jgi:glutathionylspermidine synthase
LKVLISISLNLYPFFTHTFCSRASFLNNFLVEKKCTFKDKPMPTLLKPNFISPKQTQTLQYAVENICNALTKFIGLYLENDKVRAKMKFSDLENELFFVDPGYSNPLVISRLDAFLEDYSCKFLEFNCDSPAGKAYADVLESGFKIIFNEYEFFQDWKIDYFKRQERLLTALISCYNEFRAKHSDMPTKPTIAIVDWDDVSTVSEFELLQEFFEKNGYSTIIASPLNFSIVGDKAFADGKEVHLVYKRVITRELLERYDEVQGFVESIKKGHVCVCNSFRSYIVGNKKVLALLTDPEFQDIYSEDELKVIKQTVPWTKILQIGTVKFKDYTVHLKNFGIYPVKYILI